MYRSLLTTTKPHVKDIGFMPRWQGTASLLVRNWNAASVGATGATFWTGGVGSLDRIPGTVMTSSAFTAGTWKTIASVTGSGAISDIIGPVHQGGGGPAGSTEFRATIDGVVNPVVAISHTAIAERAWIGWALPLDAYHTGNAYTFQHDATHNTGYAAKINASCAYYLMGPQDPRIPILVYFATSLLVEIRTVSQNSAGSTPGDYAAVVMRRFS